MKVTRLTIAALATTAIAWPTLALAQSANSEAGSDSGISEIIVTAQKREQKLGDVGITIAAASEAQLQSAGVSDVLNLAKVVPGFSGIETTGGYPIFSLRSVNFNGTQFSAQPAVSTYIDQVPISYPAMGGGLFLDVGRVEVLKGPQGTLFGQNATGGSINIIANKPTSTFKGGFRLDVNQFGQTEAEAYVSGPLSSTLRVRAAAQTTQGGAWQRGYYLQKGQTFGDKNKGAARLLIDWTPTEKLTVAINLNANYDKSEVQLGQLKRFVAANPAGAIKPALLATPLPSGAREAEVSAVTPPKFDNRNYHASARIDYEFSDAATLTSITSYIDSVYNRFVDFDYSVQKITDLSVEGRGHSFSQEVRLSGKPFDGKLNYVLGVNYQKDKLLDAQNNQGFFDYTAIPINGIVLTNRFNIDNRSIGVFGNVEYKLTEQLSATGGVRYTDVSEKISGCQTGNDVATGFFGGVAGFFGVPSSAFTVGQCITLDDVSGTFRPVLASLKQDENNTSWRAGLNFKPNTDTLIYGLVSRGFKQGLYPVVGTVLRSQLRPVSQEQLTAYEVGVKASLLDRRLNVNAAAFYYDYKDKQFYTFAGSPLGPTAVVRNIPKSKVEGFDFDITAKPVNGLTLRTAWTYAKSRVGAFNAVNVLLQPIVVEGKAFNNAPAWSGTADAEYRASIGTSLDGMIGVSMLYNSKTWSDLGEDPNSLVPAFTTFDARIGVESANGWSASIYVRNLTNKYYWTNVFPGADAQGVLTAMPRTFGASFVKKF